MRLLAAGLAILPAGFAFAAVVPAAIDWPSLREGESAVVRASKFPESAGMLRRAIGELVEGKRDDEARAAIAKLAAVGYALSSAGQAQLAALIEPATTQRFAANAAAEGSPSAIASIPPEFGLVESMVTIGGLRVASSITAQDLLVSRNGKAWRALGLGGLASPGGLAVDRRRGLVWASSARFDQTPRPDAAFIGLVAVDPRRAAIVRRIAAPTGMQPADILLAPDGTLYASDPFNGGLWRARPGAAHLSRLPLAATLRSPQGLALSADGKRLYVSDYGYGIAVVDLRSGNVSRLVADQPMMLDGIDGLQRAGSHLIGLQNGTRPLRVVAIRLSPDGARAVSLRVLYRRLPGEGEPTTGELSGNRLRFVSNARWDLYGKAGTLPEGTAAGATQVLSLPLSPN